MTRHAGPFLFTLAGALAGCGGPAAEAPPPAAAPPPAPVVGIDETALDPAVDPCDDFYKFACGSWLARTEIPADKSSWYRSFSVIEEQNEATLHEILDAAAAGKAGDDPYSDKVGAFYAACMAEERIEAAGLADLAEDLAIVDAVKTPADLARAVARQHRAIGAPLFGVHSQQDYADATQVILLVDQGGLGLPDRDYYLADDARSVELRAQYAAHVARMLELAGAPAARARGDAETVLRLEKALAQAALSRVDRRDPKKIYHRIDRAGLAKAAPRFPWDVYFEAVGHPTLTAINVAEPEFVAAVSTLVEKTPVADQRVYLRWHLLHAAASLLPKAFVDEDFRFYGKTLDGIAELRPRWKRCLEATDRALGEALARPFVRRTFGDDGKRATQAMIHGIESAMGENLKKLEWMDNATRAAAGEKLGAIANKVGYPDPWRNYDRLAVSRDSHLKNTIQASLFETARDFAKIGKPLDRTEWFMTPPRVNAYYEPSLNEMVFPAGILQPPFYGRSAPPAVNYGAIGMVMGHELTHGFDDEGRKFDARGNLRDWWSTQVGEEFDKRAKCVEQQYDGYVAIDDLHVKGKLTLGENIADLGGVKLAHAAWVAAHGGRGSPAGARFSDDQLFFLGYAQAWCGKRRPENARKRVLTDPHSPAEHRVNGPLSNLPEFSTAFQCKPGARMVREQRCAVW